MPCTTVCKSLPRASPTRWPWCMAITATPTRSCSEPRTSGTTGLPKAAHTAHGKFLSAGEIATQRAAIDSTDVFYCVLPLFHGAALMSLYSIVLACGATVVLRRKFSASAFWQDVRQHGVTSFQFDSTPGACGRIPYTDKSILRLIQFRSS